MADSYLFADLGSQAGKNIMHIPKCCVTSLHIAIIVLNYFSASMRNLSPRSQTLPMLEGLNMLVCYILQCVKGIIVKQLKNC